MSSAKAGFQTFLQYGDGATPEAFTTIAEITAIAPPELSVTMVEVTNMDSTNAWEEFIPVVKSGGDISVEYNYIPANTSHAAFVADLGAAARTWKITYPDFGTTNTAATVNTVTEQLTATTHGLYTGQPCRLATAGTLPTSSPQVSALVTYFARRIDANTLLLHPSNADAVANTNIIDFSTAGTGSHYVQGGTLTTLEAIASGFKSTPDLKGKIGGSGKLKPTGEITNTP